MRAANDVPDVQARAGQTITFTYDSLNRLATKTPPSPAPVVTCRYDRAGQYLHSSDPRRGDLYLRLAEPACRKEAACRWQRRMVFTLTSVRRALPLLARRFHLGLKLPGQPCQKVLDALDPFFMRPIEFDARTRQIGGRRRLLDFRQRPWRIRGDCRDFPRRPAFPPHPGPTACAGQSVDAAAR